MFLCVYILLFFLCSCAAFCVINDDHDDDDDDDDDNLIYTIKIDLKLKQNWNQIKTKVCSFQPTAYEIGLFYFVLAPRIYVWDKILK